MGMQVISPHLQLSTLVLTLLPTYLSISAHLSTHPLNHLPYLPIYLTNQLDGDLKTQAHSSQLTKLAWLRTSASASTTDKVLG